MSNEVQAKYWNDVAGPQWVEWERIFDRMLEPCQRPLLTALAPHLGDTILDVGCGFGTTSIAVGSGLGWNGRVHGVDIAAPMIERAKARIAGSPLNLSFGVLDAQTSPLHGPYDAVVSRFGVMFFDDPVAAFVNIGAATRPGGRLAFVCWQPIERNPFFQFGGRYLVPLAPEPPATPAPDAPSPFAFRDPQRTRQVLTDAGWTDIEIEPFETILRFDLDGDDGVEHAIAFLTESDLGRSVRAHASSTEVNAALDAARAELRASIVDRVVRLPAAVWIVSARRP
jgi:SAM-dependent methyltransferase